MTLGPDELVLLVYPSHPFAGRETVPMSEFAHETVIAHSDPSPARDQVLRQAELRHAPINIQIALPSLEGIKRAVEKKMGVALLPRRCAVAEIERKQLVAVKIPEVQISAAAAVAVPQGRAVACRAGVPRDCAKMNRRSRDQENSF